MITAGKFDDMLIDVTTENHIGVIHFQNDELNLLSVAFIHEFNNALDKLESDDLIHVIILTSDKRVFCAGANLKELLHASVGVKNNELPHQYDPIEDWQRLAKCRKPVVACVKGKCLGGGLEIALMCDFIVASDLAMFGFPEIKLSLLPGGGGTQRIVDRIGIGRARQMIMLGESVPGQIAYEWGLVDEIFEHDQCFDGALVIALKLSAYSGNALKEIKKLLAMASTEKRDVGLFYERSSFYECLKTPQARDNINVFLDRNK